MTEIIHCKTCSWFVTCRNVYHEEGRCPNAGKVVILPPAPVDWRIFAALDVGLGPDKTVKLTLHSDGNLTSEEVK